VKSPIIHHMLFFRLQQNRVKYQHLRSRLQFRDPWISQILTLFAQPRSTVCGKSKQRVARSNLWFYAILRLVSFFLFLSFWFFGEYPECETPIAGEFRGRLKSPGQLNHNMVPKSNRNSLKKYIIILIIPCIVDFDPCNSLQEIHLIFLNLQSVLSFHENVQTTKIR